MASKNLFENSKKSQPKKESTSKEHKIRVNIDKYKNTDDELTIFDKMVEIARLDAGIKNQQTKSDILSAEIKTIGRKEWIKLMESNKENPGSFILESTDISDISQVMFVPNDKYLKINEVKAEELRHKYNDSIITEKTTYKFNTSILEKYSDIISELIQNSELISEDDKENLVESETEYTITKGTIDKISEFENISEFVDDINPVVMLKSFEVIKV